MKNLWLVVFASLLLCSCGSETPTLTPVPTNAPSLQQEVLYTDPMSITCKDVQIVADGIDLGRDCTLILIGVIYTDSEGERQALADVLAIMKGEEQIEWQNAEVTARRSFMVEMVVDTDMGIFPLREAWEAGVTRSISNR